MTTVPTAGPAMRRLSLPGGRWTQFTLRRTARLLVSLWALLSAAFLMIHLVPGDPVRAALGPTAPPGLVAAKRASLGLDDSLLTQYLHFLKGVPSGDFGSSIVTQIPVGETIGQLLPNTAVLAGLAFMLAIAIAVPVGVFVAVRTRRGRGRRTELLFAGTSVVLGTIPDFLLGVGLVSVFAVSLGWVPVAGNDTWSSYILPVVALALGPAAVLARIVRVEMLAVLETDYIRTARSKRLRTSRINLVHALPNAATATLTLGGLLLSSLIAGTVLVENVFAWPGLGRTIVASIVSKDYAVVQGIVLVYGVGVLLINTLTDVAIAVLDPRSTIGES